MAMLTGMLPPTSGASFVYGRNVETETEAVHKMTGFCPQVGPMAPDVHMPTWLPWFGILHGTLHGACASHALPTAACCVRMLHVCHGG